MSSGSVDLGLGGASYYTPYASAAAFPATAQVGTLAFDSSTNILYVYVSGWTAIGAPLLTGNGSDVEISWQDLTSCAVPGGYPTSALTGLDDLVIGSAHIATSVTKDCSVTAKFGAIQTFIGLSDAYTASDFGSLKYGLFYYVDIGEVWAVENYPATTVATGISIAPGDVFKVSRVGDTVYALKNGVVVATYPSSAAGLSLAPSVFGLGSGLMITDALAYTGAPSSSTGVDGQQYINYTTGVLYQKANGVWVATGQIRV